MSDKKKKEVTVIYPFSNLRWRMGEGLSMTSRSREGIFILQKCARPATYADPGWAAIYLPFDPEQPVVRMVRHRPQEAMMAANNLHIELELRGIPLADDGGFGGPEVDSWLNDHPESPLNMEVVTYRFQDMLPRSRRRKAKRPLRKPCHSPVRGVVGKERPGLGPP